MASATLDWFTVIALLGAIQGFFLSGVLAVRRRNRTANRLLAALMLAFTLYLLGDAYYWAGLINEYPVVFGFSYPLPWLFGPLTYLYALAASDRSWRFRAPHALHFAPVVLVVLLALPIYMMSGEEKVALFARMQAGDVPMVIVVPQPSKYVSGLSYSVATVWYLRRHWRRIEDSYSNTEHVNLRWLAWLAGSAVAIWLLASVVGAINSQMATAWRQGEAWISTAVALLVYAIGYMGLRQPEIFRFETAEYPVPVELRADRRADTKADMPADMPADIQTDITAEQKARYERSGLSEREAERLKDKLLAVMDTQKPWKDNELTLADLAGALDTTPHKLSEVLNSQIGQTFHDFVNGYRVREVQRRIAAGEARALKMLSLALDAGFSSKSTFNQAFKKHTSQTPSDFREAVGA